MKQLRYFLAVAELGGFTQAAAALFVAQPALSRQVSLLEAELGFPLFEREPRGVSLTPAGRAYRDRVGGIQQMLARAAEEGGQLARGDAGVLRLLHSSSIPVASLTQAIERFLAASPRARIDLDRMASESQMVEVAAGRADLGVIRLPVLRREEGVRLVDLPSERLWVALPADHALVTRESLRIAELAEESFVSAVHRERGGLARRVTDLCLNRGFVPLLARVVSRKTSQLNLVAAGHGIAIIPERMMALLSEGVVYRPLDDDDATAASALVMPLNPPHLARRFVELLTA